jgi:hypothetical protein
MNKSLESLSILHQFLLDFGYSFVPPFNYYSSQRKELINVILEEDKIKIKTNKKQ